MLRPRIIPCLLVHNRGLVKTVQFGRPKYVGDPLNAVRIFNEKEVDELAVFDIDATALGHEPDLAMIQNLATECRMPLCYGGGVTTTRQAIDIIGLGVEKVALSAAIVERPQLVSELARLVGSQSVVAVLDVRKPASDAAYTVWTHNGRRNTGRDVLAVARELANEGVGEIVVNNIDRDGTGVGYDLSLARSVRAVVTVPLTLLGGAGSIDDIGALFRACGIVGAAAGSLFVFKGIYRAVLINYPSRAVRDSTGLKALLPNAAKQ